MTVVVVGAGGLVGTRVVYRLRACGRAVVAASRATGVDARTGTGLAAALAGAGAVVDVTDAPSWDGEVALDVLPEIARTLVAAARAADVAHYVALSIVGADRLAASGYFRAKREQEAIVQASGLSYTILRATPFYESLARIAEAGAEGETIRLAPALTRPVAADDVALALADIASAPPADAVVELAGPEPLRLDALIVSVLRADDDPRRVVADATAPFFGAPLDDRSLMPGPDPRVGATRFADWLRSTLPM